VNKNDEHGVVEELNTHKQSVMMQQLSVNRYN